ncbi:1-phosphofructokinase [Olsenella intestinalis]|uniref:1-phosphofructokinase n=1 Tax=Olsenella intestinalis TaxID=2930083 RepID=UPI00200F5C32|nr:1-phosphofructokinase [Olsenella intestinalis]
MIFTVTLNPALDKTAQAPNFKLDAVTRITELRQDPGGKGINVSKVIKQLGGESVAWAVLGGNTGRGIKASLEDMGISCRAFEVEGETRTNLKVVDPVDDTHTDINEPGPVVTDAMLDDMLAQLVAEISEGDIVVLAGSIARGASDDTYEKWVKACREAGAKVFLDADGDKLVAGIKGNPFLIKPNEIELGNMLGRTLDTDEKVAEAARELIAQGLDNVVVSMGGAGAMFVSADRVVKGGSVKVPVGSTVGAGDSVVAALAFAEEKGMSLEDKVKLSMATGAANVMQSGTQAAPRDLVDSLIEKVTVTEM